MGPQYVANPTVVHTSYRTEPEQVRVVQSAPVVHSTYETAPVHQEVAFATEANNDALPVNHGDAYHGTAQGTYTQVQATNHYYTSGSNYGYRTAQAYTTVGVYRGSAGIWWIILFVTLLILAAVGIYYYCCRGSRQWPFAPPIS